jgi:hypothetical protein
MDGKSYQRRPRKHESASEQVATGVVALRSDPAPALRFCVLCASQAEGRQCSSSEGRNAAAFISV